MMLTYPPPIVGAMISRIERWLAGRPEDLEQAAHVGATGRRIAQAANGTAPLRGRYGRPRSRS